MSESNYVEHKSGLKFAETVAMLVDTIEKVGMNVVAKIDHGANAQDVGMHLPPSVVLLYGHARGGTPVMQAAPRAALDLPLRVLVRESEGKALVAYHPAAEMLKGAGVPEGLVTRLDGAQRIIVESLKD